MKNSPLPSAFSNPANERPKLVCRVMRWAHAGQDDDGTSEGMAGRHAENCQACADYFARIQSLEQTLVEERVETNAIDIPAGLEDRIWAAVRPEVEAYREPAKPWWRADWRPGLGGAVAAALVFVVWSNQDSKINENATPGGETVATGAPLEFNEADMRALVATVETFSTELLTASARETDVTAKPTVMQQELQALGSDARGALRFLGQNFLPKAGRSREEV